MTLLDFKDRIERFETFVMCGAYAEKKESEKNRKIASQIIQERLSDSEGRRHEFKQQGMVAKFVPKEVRKIDHKGLIEEILNYIRSEELSEVISLNHKQIETDELMNMIEPYRFEQKYYVKPTLNNYGKSFNYTLQEDFSNASIDLLLRAIKHYSNRIKKLEGAYHSIMSPFHQMKEKKIQTQVGSISKIPHKPTYNIGQVVEELGEEFLLNYGEVKVSELDNWIALGAFPKHLLSKHQQVIDIRLDFMVMTFEAEERAFNAFLKQKRSA